MNVIRYMSWAITNMHDLVTSYFIFYIEFFFYISSFLKLFKFQSFKMKHHNGPLILLLFLFKWLSYSLTKKVSVFMQQ